MDSCGAVLSLYLSPGGWGEAAPRHARQGHRSPAPPTPQEEAELREFATEEEGLDLDGALCVRGGLLALRRRQK